MTRIQSYNLILLLSFLSSISVYGRVPSAELGGLHDLIDAQYHSYSPIFGCIALKNHVLENINRHGIDEPMTRLVREIFNTPDRVTFEVTRKRDKLASHLTPSVAGKMIGIISKHIIHGNLRATLEHEDSIRKLKLELLSTLEELPVFMNQTEKSLSNIELKRRELQGFRSKLNMTLRDCKQADSSESIKNLAEIIATLEIKLQEKLEETWEKSELKQGDIKDRIENKVRTLNAKIDKSSASLSAEASEIRASHTMGRKMAETFIDRLVEALKDTTHPESHYDAEFPIHILSGMICEKESKPGDILELAQSAGILKSSAMPQNLKTLTKNTFADISRSAADYTYLSQKQAAELKLVWNTPDLALFMAEAESIYSYSTPPLVSQGTATYTHSPPGETPNPIIFQDCYESTLQNLPNLILRLPGTGKMNVDRLVAKARESTPPFEINRDFVKFYQDYPELTNPHDPKRRNAWAQMVSNVPLVRYSQEVCNMYPTLENALQLFGHLLFPSNPAYQGLRTNVEKMDYLTDFLSAPKYKLSWQLDRHPREALNQLSTNFKIEFLINNDPKIGFDIQTQHGEPYKLAKEGISSWSHNFSNRISDWDRWTRSKENEAVMTLYPTPVKGSRPEFLNELLLSRPMESNQDILKALRFLLGCSNPRDFNIPDSYFFKMAQSLIRRLPLDDPHIAYNIAEILMTNHYDDEHILSLFMGKPQNYHSFIEAAIESDRVDLLEKAQERGMNMRISIDLSLIRKALDRENWSLIKFFATHNPELFKSTTLSLKTLAKIYNDRNWEAIEVLARVSPVSFETEFLVSKPHERPQRMGTLKYILLNSGKWTIVEALAKSNLAQQPLPLGPQSFAKALFDRNLSSATSDVDFVLESYREGRLNTLTLLANAAPFVFLKPYTSGNTLPHLAAEDGNSEILEMLLKVDPRMLFWLENKDGENTLHILAKKGNIVVLRRLLELDPKLVGTLYFKNQKGKSPLDYASEHHHENILELVSRYPQPVGLAETRP